MTSATGWGVLLWGFALGLRHASDADHVAVVTTLLQREPGVWRAARIAALWGAGHTVSFLAIGLLIVLAQLHPSAAFEEAAELLVAAMLIGVGLWNLKRIPGESEGAPQGKTGLLQTLRPMAVGLIHGLAGSAGVGLLTASTISSRGLASLYLALFGLGTILGMVLLTVIIANPIAWSLKREGSAKRVVGTLASLLSITLGITVLVGML